MQFFGKREHYRVIFNRDEAVKIMLAEEALPQFRLGDLLLEKGLVSQQQLAEALSYQQSSQMALGNVLITLGCISERQLKRCLRRQRWVRLIAGMVITMVPAATCHALEMGKKRGNGSASFYDTAENRLAEGPSGYSIGIRYAFNNVSGLNIDIQPRQEFSANMNWQPSVSIYQRQYQKPPEPSRYYAHVGLKQHEVNRYKDATPVLYRLTLKGYSLFEANAEQSKYFNFERYKGDPARKYQLMFSVTKRFN